MGFNDIDIKVSGGSDIISTLQTYTTKILKPNIVDGKNVLMQEMLSSKNTKYIIKYNFELLDATLTIPQNVILEFDGGSIKNGTLVGNETLMLNTNETESVLDNVTLDGTWKESSYDLLEEVVADKAPGDGMGRIILRKDKTFAEQLTQENTIYVIRYDFELSEDVTIPANCVLEFDGGSLSGAAINGVNGITIEGYGCLCNLVNADKISFVKPYCVSTIHGLKIGADGSPNKPFYYLQDALDVCNNVVIECGSFLWINQYVHTHDVNPTNHYMFELKHATKINTYGTGRNPVISADFTLKAANVSKASESVVGDLYDTVWNVNLSSTINKTDYTQDTGSSQITAVEIGNYAAILLNTGIYTDSGTRLETCYSQCGDVNKATEISNRYNADVVVYHSKETTERVNSKDYFSTFHTLSKFRLSTFTIGSCMSASIIGIGCQGHTLNIENIDFRFLSFGVAHAFTINCKNCKFEYIGGQIQSTIHNTETNNFVTFGNAIESYFGVEDNSKLYDIISEINNCYFNQIYDTAITIQGIGFGVDSWHYMGRFVNNIINNTRMGMEFFNRDAVNNLKFSVLVGDNTFSNCNKTRAFLWYVREGQYGAIRFGSTLQPAQTRIRVHNNKMYNSPMYVNTQNGYTQYDFVNNILFIAEGDYAVRREYVDGPESNSLKVDRTNLETVVSAINVIGNRNQNNSIVLLNAGVKHGVSSDRPTYLAAGGDYFDTTINKPIYWTGTAWVDATGQTV